MPAANNLLYEYRLAPEYSFPAALDDSVKIYKWLLSSGFEPDNIIIAGESAGGGLCLATLLALKERNIPMPVAGVAISPWTDLTCSSESYKTKNKLSPAPLNSWTIFSKYYVGDNKAENPLISPLFGDLIGLPPILINSGGNNFELYFEYVVDNRGILDILKGVNESLVDNGLFVFGIFESNGIFDNFDDFEQDIEHSNKKIQRISKLKLNLSTGWTYDWFAKYIIDEGGKVSESEDLTVKAIMTL